MRWLLRLLGGAAGFTIGIVLVDIVFANNATGPRPARRPVSPR